MPIHEVPSPVLWVVWGVRTCSTLYCNLHGDFFGTLYIATVHTNNFNAVSPHIVLRVCKFYLVRSGVFRCKVV